ncbi:MAG: hypothetical protein MK180_18030 [Rhodobacteraceae bacterium]|nr:hypothetical protein [Paracoccaceae bacterium]
MHFTTKPVSLSAFALSLLSFAAPVTAEQVVVTSPCQGAVSPATAADMGRYLAGNWNMVAPGTGFTTGTNVGQVSLRFDEATSTLFMEGGGASVPLIPIGMTRNLGEAEPPVPNFDASIEALTPLGLSADEVALVSGCVNPARYWWSMSIGGNSSWGALAFIFEDAASGYMANSAGGSRQMQLSR